MPLSWRVLGLTLLALMAFAGNSLLSRAALHYTPLDAASFTLIRIASAALMLYALLLWQRPRQRLGGSWLGASLLFAYAALFSYAYIELNTATGALLLFGAVQLTMLVSSIIQTQRISRWQWLGAALACVGILGLLLPGVISGVATPTVDTPGVDTPGVDTPGVDTLEPLAALAMLVSGMAWAGYSLLGRYSSRAAADTAGNFIRAILLALAVSIILVAKLQFAWQGAVLAMLSGAITSGLGYYIWYLVLPSLSTIQAASVQLAVPVLAAILGVVLLAEVLSLRLVLASAVVLAGLALVLFAGPKARSV